jgi:hypothetical protein
VTDRQIDRHTDRQINRQIDRQKDRQTKRPYLWCKIVARGLHVEES